MAVLAFAVAGAYVGGTALAGGAIGAAVGWTAGSLIGNMLFPQKASSPPLQDVHVMYSAAGAYIPQLYGSIRTRLIITDGADTFTRHEGDSGGKGGGSQPTPDTYSIDWFRGLICEGNGQHTLGRVWHTGRMVGDYREGAANAGELPLVFYDGNATQTADPTEEAVFGAGMRSAFRNIASVVYTDLSLGETGNALPNINVEVIQGAIETDKPLEVIVQNNNTSEPHHDWGAPDGTARFGFMPVVLQWPPSGGDDDARIRILAINGELNGGVHNVHTYNADTLAYIGSETAAVGERFPQDIGYEGALIYSGLGWYEYASGTRVKLWAALARFKVDESYVAGPTYSAGPPIVFGDAPDVSIPPVATGDNFLQVAGLTSSDIPKWAALSEDGKMLFVLVTTAAQAAIDDEVADKWYRIVDGDIDSSGAVDLLDFTFPPNVSPVGHDPYHIAGMCENDYRHLWAAASNSSEVGCFWINDSDVFERAPAHVTAVPAPSGGLSLTGDIADIGSGYERVLGIYALPEGCKCGVVTGYSAWLVERCERTDGFIRLYEMVDDQHRRSGSADGTWDSSELVDIVRGAGIFARPTGRSAIESWQDLYGFVPSGSTDGIVRYVKLGKASVLTIPDEDLCAHDENGSEIPSPLQVVLGNDIELPCQIFLKYFDYNANYEVGVQSWHRQHTQSRVVRTIEASVVLTAKEAKQMVDAIGERTIREADKYTFHLLKKAAYSGATLIPYVALVPSDVVTVLGLDLRITNVTQNMATGVLKFEAVRSHHGVIIQTGVGGGESEGVPTQEIPPPQETELYIGDIPWIEDEGRQRVVQVAMQGELRRSWKGAQLNKSSDGGSNYEALLTDNDPATIGETLTALPNFGGGKVFDEGVGVEVEIHLGGGELVSATRRAVFGGANYAMVGAEMIQFKGAELIDSDPVTYRLTGLLRGRHGTEWAMRGHAAGDIFCLLPTPVTLDALPIDYGHTRLYKAVTLGRTLATADAYSFRSNGVSLAPYAPASLAAGFTGDPGASDIGMTCRRRTRLGRGWVNARAPTGQDSAPLGEATEAYRIKIYEDGTFQTVVRTVDTLTLPFLYTEAMQTEDFGSPLSVLPAWGIAQIGALGPGYELLSNGLGAALPLFVPAGDDYVPPIPPPSEAIDDVMTWSEATTINSGTFGPDDAWVIQFTTGSADSGVGGLVRLQGAEFAGPPAPRQWTLSPIAGDFGPQAMPGAQGYGSPSVTALFVVGSGDDFGFYPTIPQATTWYLNIRNQPSGYLDMPMFCTLLNIP